MGLPLCKQSCINIFNMCFKSGTAGHIIDGGRGSKTFRGANTQKAKRGYFGGLKFSSPSTSFHGPGLSFIIYQIYQ